MKRIQRAVYVILLCAVLCITGCSQSQKTDQAAGDEKPAVSSDASNAAGSEVPAASHVQMLDYNKDLTRTLTDDNYRTTYEIFLRISCKIASLVYATLLYVVRRVRGTPEHRWNPPVTFDYQIQEGTHEP